MTTSVPQPTPPHTVALTTGVADPASPVLVPQVGFGTWQVEADVAQGVVSQALAAGYRHIDTAAGYGNEEQVGAAIRASGLPREEVFVTTKLRNGEQGYAAALRAFEDSRRRLGLDVVDLYLIHWPVPSQGKYVETWRAFVELLQQGAVRAIGVSNFLPAHLAQLRQASDVLPAVNQIELHPTFQQRDVQEDCQRHGVAVEAYSPLGQGRDLNDPSVTAIAQRLGVTPGQVVLRWHVQHGHIVIPKTATPARLAENLDLFSFELSAADMAAVDTLDSDARMASHPDVASFTQMPK